MLFNLESDTGTRVTGYLVPDAFSAVPTIRVVGGGRELLTLAANERREALVVAGRHETGQCGFSVDVSSVPGLKDIDDLEIYDAETGVLIYRRRPPAAVAKKILRVESHLFPLWHLDEGLRPHFQYFAKGVENLGSETVTQLFLLNQVNSVFLSGRILYRNYSVYIDNGFSTLFLMQNPYEELAERLLVLSKIRKIGGSHLGLRDELALAETISYAEELTAEPATITDRKALRRMLRRMPMDVAAILSNPVTRTLTVATPDEMPGPNAIAHALDILSTAAVVGLREEADTFVNAVYEFLGLKGASRPSLPRLTAVAPFAAALRDAGDAELMLEKDLELYQRVLEAQKRLSERDAIKPSLSPAHAR